MMLSTSTFIFYKHLMNNNIRKVLEIIARFDEIVRDVTFRCFGVVRAMKDLTSFFLISTLQHALDAYLLYI